MEMPPLGAEPQAPLSPWQRLAAIFTRPSTAWAGLETKGQWWFPLAILIVFNGAMGAALHQRALMPMIVEQWEQAVERGDMTAAQLENMETSMRGPLGIVLTSVQQALAWVVILLISALGVWFGVGFILGSKFRYRLAFEISCWSALILVPAQVLAGVLAWSKQTFRGIHLGLGILVPEADAPSKLLTGLASFLDAFSPFALWSVWVTVLGATVLSGAPRKSVTWVVVALYLVMAIFMAAMAGLFTQTG